MGYLELNIAVVVLTVSKREGQTRPRSNRKRQSTLHEIDKSQ